MRSVYPISNNANSTIGRLVAWPGPHKFEKGQKRHVCAAELCVLQLALKLIAASKIKTSNAVVVQIWCWCTTWANAAADILGTG